MRFLIVGRGSIGRRHESILLDMGHDVGTIDPDPKAAATWARWQRMPSTEFGTDFDGVLICTPSNIRNFDDVPVAIHSPAYFVEKPLGAFSLKSDGSVMVGFVYRWCESLRSFQWGLGRARIYSLHIKAGDMLGMWHPDEDYRRRYHGTPGVGGVVLDSFPHIFSIARWILGDVRVVGASTGHLSSLDIRTEDTASVLLKSENGVACLCHSDYLRDTALFEVEAVTSDGVQRWTFDRKRDLDQMYHSQMEAFVEVCAGTRRYGYPDYAEGKAVDALIAEVRG